MCQQLSISRKQFLILKGFRVDFVKAGKNVRSDLKLPNNYIAERQTKNNASVAHFI